MENNHINYDDNLFFITARLQLMKQSLSLNLDAEFLAEAYKSDLKLFDTVLIKFYNNLVLSPNLIKLNDYLHNLQRAQNYLIDIINLILDGETSLTVAFTNSREELATICQGQIRNKNFAKEQLSKTTDQVKELDVIGEEELSFLLMPDDDANEK